MNARVLGPAIALSLCLVPVAHAERQLSLDEAIAIARRENRDLKQARARLEQTATTVEQAWAALLPTVTAQGKYTHNYKEVTLDLSHQNDGLLGLAGAIVGGTSDPGLKASVGGFQQAVANVNIPSPVIQKADQLDATISLNVPLIVPSGYPALAASKRTLSAAESGFAVTEAQVLLSAAQSFFLAAGADEVVTARGHAVEVARTTVDNARARFESGTVNRVEVARAQLALVRAEQSLAEARDAQAQAYRALATLLALREPVKVAVAVPPVAPEDTSRLAEQALKLRPEQRQLTLTASAAASQTLSATLRWAPTLSAFAQARFFNYAGFSGDYYAWAAGAQLDWQLYDGGVRDAQRHLAQAQRREAEARLELLRDTVTDEVLNAGRALATRRRALATAEESLKLSRETLDLVRAQHDAGTATQLDLLQAQDALVAAEVGLAQARFDLALADLTLRRAAGTFPTAKAD